MSFSVITLAVQPIPYVWSNSRRPVESESSFESESSVESVDLSGGHLPLTGTTSPFLNILKSIR